MRGESMPGGRLGIFLSQINPDSLPLVKLEPFS
jgi:hypothetical protein